MATLTLRFFTPMENASSASVPTRSHPMIRRFAIFWKRRSAARKWNFEGPEPEIFGRAEDALTRAQSSAVADLVNDAGLSLSDIGVVGFHGQTVLHRAPQPGRLGATRQLGDGELMAKLLGTKVAYDFRSADVRAGGQGAPLAAAYHSALLKGVAQDGSAAILNLGGVGNVTWSDGKGHVVAFDTGRPTPPSTTWIKQHGLGDWTVTA